MLMTSIRHRFQFLAAGTFVICLLLSESSVAVVTLPFSQVNNPSPYTRSVAVSGPHLLVQNEVKNKVREYPPKSGTLLMPSDTTKKEDKEGKKCMTVCNRWGQDCIIDPARGRQCRRTCKEFGEECF